MDNIEQKAKELVEKFRNEYKWVETDYPVDLYRESKQCAIIYAEEIIDVLGGQGVYSFADPKVEKYWQQVKEKIQSL